MVAITPDQPWFYLIIYGSFMVFILLFGIIVTLSQRKKKKKQEIATDESVETPN